MSEREPRTIFVQSYWYLPIRTSHYCAFVTDWLCKAEILLANHLAQCLYNAELGTVFVKFQLYQKLELQVKFWSSRILAVHDILRLSIGLSSAKWQKFQCLDVSNLQLKTPLPRCALYLYLFYYLAMEDKQLKKCIHQQNSVRLYWGCI